MSWLTQQITKSTIVLLVIIILCSCSKPNCVQKGRYHIISFDNQSIIVVKNKKLKFIERGVPSMKSKYYIRGDSAIETLGGKREVYILIVKSGDHYILDPNHYCYQKDRKDLTYRDCLRSHNVW